MVIENRNLLAGTHLVANYKKQTHVCTVEVSADGEHNEFVLTDGRRFKSPSAAGAAVIGGACNGWRFWSLEGEAPAPKVIPTPKTKAQPAAMPKLAKRRRQQAKAKPAILQRHDNQDDLSEGETRWVCNACLKHFTVYGNETPEACPEGHRNDDAELASLVADAAVKAEA